MLIFQPGFHMHPIQGRLTASSPWGWRAGTVGANDGAVVEVHYLLEEATIAVWHHEPLELPVGAPVRVHEEFGVLDLGDAWVCVKVHAGGLGPVPEPDVPEAWAHEVTGAILQLQTGRVVPQPLKPGQHPQWPD